MMKVGLVGMPNAGKSSLFNALSPGRRRGRELPVHDDRAQRRRRARSRTSGWSRSPRRSRRSNIVWDTIEFHDIAGLVAGASKGEGLGNKFLANIRECDALLHVVRTHTDENVIHPDGPRRPGARTSRRSRPSCCSPTSTPPSAATRKVVRDARSGDRAAVAEEAWLRQVIEALQAGKPARTVPVPARRARRARNLSPLTGKPVLFVANVDEGEDAVPSVVADHAAATGAAAVAISSRVEAELSELDDEEAAMMREELGVGESGLQPRRQRRVRPAAPDRVLHRRRGQARADLAPARRASPPGTPRARSTRTSRRGSCAPR